MNNCCWRNRTDFGPDPYVTNVEGKAMQNVNFRTALWTGRYAQMTLMCIPVGCDIGLELHEDTDQFIRIEHGMAMIKMGECEDWLDFQANARTGDIIFVPAGTVHDTKEYSENAH